MPLNILVMEPFGGGSHASLYEGWKRHSNHALTVLELPAVHWKWRSRHASLTLAQMADEHVRQGMHYDLVWCTDMLNLPEWRGCSQTVVRDLPAVVYFHENQFTYPLSTGQTRDYHYAYSNLLTAVVADETWFNSAYHQQDFFSAARSWLRKMPDYKHNARLEAAAERSIVLSPGISPPSRLAGREDSGVSQTLEAAPRDHSAQMLRKPGQDFRPTLGWVARWEHDKRPDLFLQLVETLVDRDIDFDLVLLGQQFPSQHSSLERLLEVAGTRVVHCGYKASKAEYWSALSQIDWVVSTADHEFFGIGVLEAMYAGARPMLPRRLSYPELVGCQMPSNTKHGKPANDFLYDSQADLMDKLTYYLSHSPVDWPAPPRTRNELQAYCWDSLAAEYDQACEALLRR